MLCRACRLSSALVLCYYISTNYFSRAHSGQYLWGDHLRAFRFRFASDRYRRVHEDRRRVENAAIVSRSQGRNIWASMHNETHRLTDEDQSGAIRFRRQSKLPTYRRHHDWRSRDSRVRGVPVDILPTPHHRTTTRKREMRTWPHRTRRGLIWGANRLDLRVLSRSCATDHECLVQPFKAARSSQRIEHSLQTISQSEGGTRIGQ